MDKVKVLIVGSGGRELAIAKAIHRSSIKHSIYAIGSYDNAELANLCEDGEMEFVNDLSRLVLISCAARIRPNLCIIGSEEPLQQDIVTTFMQVGGRILCIGPPANIAQLETDKQWCRFFLHKYGLDQYSPQILNSVTTDCVIKPTGLCGGKGVKVSGDHFTTVEEGKAYCRELHSSNMKYIIEEKLVGREFSCMSLTDGRNCAHFPVAVDFKRAFDGDKGPNTGGMGCLTYQTRPEWLSQSQYEEACKLNERVVQCLAYEFPTNKNWAGVVFGGFMLTDGGQIKLLEYNMRFGDPEAIGVLSSLSLDYDILDLFLSAISGTLRPQYLVAPARSCTVYVVPRQYPTKSDSISTIRFHKSDLNVLSNLSAYSNCDLSIIDGCMNSDWNTGLSTPSSSRTFALCAVGEQAITRMPEILVWLATVPVYQELEGQIHQLGTFATYFRWRCDIMFSPAPEVWLNEFKSTDETAHAAWYAQRKKNVITGSSAMAALGVVPPATKDVYAEAGVNIESGNQAVASIQSTVRSTYTSGVLDFPGGFGGVFKVDPDASGEVILVSSTDSVGSKSVFNDKLFTAEESLRNSGISIVNHCVNDIMAMGCTTPLFFLDYFATDQIRPNHLRYFVEGLSQACREAGCALIGGETAEIKDIYQPNTRDLVGFITGAVARKDLLHPRETLREHDVCIALPSNSAHTNGFTLLNSILRRKTADGTLDENTMEWMKQIAQPHKSYLPEIRGLRANGIPFKGLVHITGGGFIDNPPRVLPPNLNVVFQRNTIEERMPSMFRSVWKESGIAADDFMQMYRIYNCGVGLIIIVDPFVVPSALAHLPPSAFVIGEIGTKQSPTDESVVFS
jgi:phosphoribosylamine--glycine ligase/phosphoribosylaminoimidazole synthetase